MNKISFVVLTYNSNIKKLKQTLFSIISQNNIDYEIIIADDGSSNNHEDEIKKYLLENNFTNYKLVLNSTNKGTVKNILCALDYVTGNLVKLISPGDYIYNNDTIFLMEKFFTENKADILFGKVIKYNTNGINVSRSTPRIIKPYLKNNYKKIKHNILFTRDLIIGASILYDYNILKEYINKIEPYVIYSEDTLLNYYIAEKDKLFFWNEDSIYYEIGEGISTSNSNRWNTIISEEVNKVFHHLYQNKLITKIVYKNNILKNQFQKFFFSIFFDFSNTIYRIIYKITSKEYFRDITENDKLHEYLSIE